MSIVPLEHALHRARSHQQAGQLPQAEALCRQILATLPRQPDALHLLGVIALQTQHFQDALDLISQAIAVQAANPAFYLSLGEVYLALGQADHAAASFRRALKIDPGCAPAHFLLGALHYHNRRPDKAVTCYQRALAIKPGYAQAHCGLGLALYRTGRLSEASASFERALALHPAYAEASYNLGVVLVAQEQPEPARACFQKAVELQPDYASAWNNLGTAWFNEGRIGAAIDCFRQAVRLVPGKPLLHSSLIFALLFDPGVTAQEIAAEQQQWNQRFAVPLRTVRRPHANIPDADRRLKIGYVSRDFCAHACGHFLVPLLEAHDHAQVEVFCYAHVPHPDHITQRLQQSADVWRDALALSDDELAEQIRKDGIDILVDLSMHTSFNRLPMFARKPAPVQASWLAYPGSTGLETIDYRLTDDFLEAADLEPRQTQETSSQQDNREQAIRLPDSFWCYDPLTHEPGVNGLPARGGQHFTFGCLNNFSKINPPTLALWARVLAEVPESRLLLLASPGSHRERTREHFQNHGIAGERIQFSPRHARPQYLELYHQVDLVLDTFPYSGHTTTCDALWMGVPVVTLAGRTAVGRGGVSLLSNIGLPELVGHTEDEYVRIAVDLAQDLPRLADLRATMRARMSASPLMDGPRFARGIEAAYRQMWTNWCAGKAGR